jgi:hypothetical protein
VDTRLVDNGNAAKIDCNGNQYTKTEITNLTITPVKVIDGVANTGDDALTISDAIDSSKFRRFALLIKVSADSVNSVRIAWNPLNSDDVFYSYLQYGKTITAADGLITGIFEVMADRFFIELAAHGTTDRTYTVYLIPYVI